MSNKKMDTGAGIVSKPPESQTMKFYKQVQASGGYDSKGHPVTTGKQSEKLPGHQGSSDPTKGKPKYVGDAKTLKGPEQVVSKRKASKVHTLKKGMTKGKGKLS